MTQKLTIDTIDVIKHRIKSYYIAIEGNSSPFFNMCMYDCIERDTIILQKLKRKCVTKINFSV
jgi:hypothetical protein